MIAGHRPPSAPSDSIEFGRSPYSTHWFNRVGPSREGLAWLGLGCGLLFRAGMRRAHREPGRNTPLCVTNQIKSNHLHANRRPRPAGPAACPAAPRTPKDTPTPTSTPKHLLAVAPAVAHVGMRAHVRRAHDQSTTPHNAPSGHTPHSTAPKTKRDATDVEK